MSGSSSSAVEIDFFRLRGEEIDSAVSSAPTTRKLSDRRDIQGVISKINPELLKTAIASASAANKGFVASKSSCPPSPDHQTQTQTLPVYSEDCAGVRFARGAAAPLTIFYNGSVSVFDVSPEMAESIMKLAESGSTSSGSKTVVESTTAVDSKPTKNQNQAIAGALNKDLPLSRKKSLRRFLEKRKERQVSISPYAYSQGNASWQ